MNGLFARFDLDLKPLIKGRRLRKPPRQKFPMSIEREYTRELIKYVQRMKEIVIRDLVSALPSLSREVSMTVPEQSRQDAWPDEIARRINDIKVGLARAYTPAELTAIARKAGTDVDAFHKRAIKEQFKRVLGIDIFASEPWHRNTMAAFVNQNVNLITTIEQRQLGRVNNIVSQGFATGLRHEEIAKELVSSFDIAESDAARIARDQVSKLNGQLTMLRQTEVGVEKYRWITALDDRVRPSHEEKHGKVYAWNDPPNDTGHPGEDINCRCYAEPIFAGESTEEE